MQEVATLISHVKNLFLNIVASWTQLIFMCVKSLDARLKCVCGFVNLTKNKQYKQFYFAKSLF